MTFPTRAVAAVLFAVVVVVSGVPAGVAGPVAGAVDGPVGDAAGPSVPSAPAGYPGGGDPPDGDGGDDPPEDDDRPAVEGVQRLSPEDRERIDRAARSGVAVQSVTHPYGDPVDGDRYLVHVVLTGADAARDADLEALGAEVHVRVGRDVEVLATLETIEALSAAPFVDAVLPVVYLETPPQPDVDGVADAVVRAQSGALTSQGVAEIGADRVHSLGVTGQGVTVGVIDDAFDPNNPEIAANVVEYRNFDGAWQNPTSPDRQHGTAVTEAVVDVAPDVRIYFAKPATQTQWAAAAQWLVDQDVDVITSSTGFSGVPLDGTAIIDRAVDDAVAAGVPVTVAAGNEAENHWEGPFRDDDGDGFHEYDAQSGTFLLLNGGQGLAPGQTVVAFLTWDEWPTTDQDYDFYLAEQRADGRYLIAGSEFPQDGSPNALPREVVVYTASAPTGPVGLVIRNYDADGTSDVEIFTRNVDIVAAVPEGSIASPGTSRSAIAVGAFYHATDELEDYSSWGPTNDGRQGIDVIGPTRVLSSTYDGSFGFAGTSAANPHVAGVAALMLQANPDLTPAEVEQTIRRTAVDYGAPGPDIQSGTGRVDAFAAVQAVRDSTTPTPGPTPTPTPSPPTGEWQTLTDDPDEPSIPVDLASVAARDDASTLYFRYTYHGDYAANSPVETQMYLDVDDDATTGQFVADPGVGLDYVVVSTPTGFGLFEYDAATGQYTNTGTTSPHFVPDFVGNAHEVGVPLSAFSSTGSPGPGATVRILGLQFYGADTQNPQRDFVPDVGDMSFVVGAPGTTPTPVPTPGPGAETVVSVVLDGAPNGLQQYRITVSGATVVSTEPDLIGGGLFQEVAGGEGETFVTVRAADLVQGVGAFTDTRTLFTVTFVGDVDVDDLTLTVEDLRDDGSADMDPGRVRLVASSSAVFTGPVPGSGGAAPPTDLDGDGLYEDVDGDGDADFDDAIALAFVDSSALTPAQTAALDFDSDGDVDFDDAIELAFQV